MVMQVHRVHNITFCNVVVRQTTHINMKSPISVPISLSSTLSHDYREGRERGPDGDKMVACG